jgi:hypothetical protein
MPKETSRSAATQERPSSFVSLLSGWVQQGVESFFATQRILVDLAMRQNTNAMNTIREEISMTDSKANKEGAKQILVELAVEGTANYIEAQRILLDLAQQENDIVLNGVTERVGEYGPVAAMTNVVRRSIDTFIDMQHNFLTLASKRTQGWLESSQGTGKADLSPVSLAAEAMEEFVATQKKFLNVVAEEARMDGKKEHAKKTDKTELIELGREATNSFIKAQKKLLDLAGQQANFNMQAANRVGELKMPIRFMPVADMANEGVKSFVDAEKALVDTLVKTRNHAKEPVKTAAHVKEPVKTTHAKPHSKAKAPHAAAAKA